MPPSTAQGGNRPSHGQSCRRDVAAPLDHGVNVGVDAADEITESQEEFEDDDTPDAGPLGVSLKLEYSALPVDQSMAVFVLCKVAKKPHTTTDDDPGDDTRDKPSPAAAAVAAADISVPRPGGAVSVSEGGGVGLDLVTVLDVSGSMSGAKLGSVQDAMRFVIGQLTDKDRLCVISFSSAARVELPFTLMTEAKKSLATTRSISIPTRQTQAGTWSGPHRRSLLFVFLCLWQSCASELRAARPSALVWRAPFSVCRRAGHTTRSARRFC